MMPCALVEFKADVVKIDAGKKKKCGHIEVCRFGCSCHYTDASGWAYHMKADEPTLADAIKKAKEQGVEFIFSDGSWEFYAYGANGKELLFEDDGSGLTYAPYAEEFSIKMGIRIAGCDDYIHCKE
jgi:predicted peroxiredoxin